MISSLFLGLVIVTLLYTCHPPFQHRVDQSLGIFSYDYEQADVATARRLDLWKTSIAIFRGNWVNGTGPRSFRNVYSGYADADDFWMENGRSGQTHPHQFVMEIAAETGIIGIIGYFLFWLSLLVAMWREHKAEWLAKRAASLPLPGDLSSSSRTAAGGAGIHSPDSQTAAQLEGGRWAKARMGSTRAIASENCA